MKIKCLILPTEPLTGLTIYDEPSDFLWKAVKFEGKCK